MTENKQILGKSGDPREDAINSLFSNTENESLFIENIPSKGRFYKDFQGIEVTPLTFLDEQRILGSRKQNADIVSDLLEKTVKGVQIEELLPMDKIFLLMKVREISYGELYKFKISCPNCEADVGTELVLSENLNMSEVPDDLEDPREFDLPKLGVKAKVRFPRNKEENYIKDAEASFKNLYKFVVEINGSSDPVFIAKALKRMHIMDVKKILAEVSRSEYGIDPRFIFECPECSHSETMAIPMDISFFSVS
jgi:hypothetical protein|tara:strand:+ start:379 stop:1134 length:756 start_codon:yes stop_codon:yes gene_type:complete